MEEEEEERRGGGGRGMKKRRKRRRVARGSERATPRSRSPAGRSVRAGPREREDNFGERRTERTRREDRFAAELSTNRPRFRVKRRDLCAPAGGWNSPGDGGAGGTRAQRRYPVDPSVRTANAVRVPPRRKLRPLAHPPVRLLLALPRASPCTCRTLFVFFILP